MKYLMTYESYGKDIIKSVINDAISNLSDDGYDIKIYDHNWNVMKVRISNSNNRWFNFRDIKSEIVELISQLKGYDVKLTQISTYNNYDPYKMDFDNAFTSMSLDMIERKLNEYDRLLSDYNDDQSVLRPDEHTYDGYCTELIFIYNQE